MKGQQARGLGVGRISGQPTGTESATCDCSCNAATRRRWDDLTDKQKAFFALSNLDRIAAFDEMLTEALDNPLRMQWISIRDLLHMHESFSGTMSEIYRGMNELVAGGARRETGAHFRNEAK